MPGVWIKATRDASQAGRRGRTGIKRATGVSSCRALEVWGSSSGKGSDDHSIMEPLPHAGEGKSGHASNSTVRTER